MGVGREPKVGSSIHLNRKAVVVCLSKSTNSNGLLVRPIRLLTVV